MQTRTIDVKFFFRFEISFKRGLNVECTGTMLLSTNSVFKCTGIPIAKKKKKECSPSSAALSFVTLRLSFSTKYEKDIRARDWQKLLEHRERENTMALLLQIFFGLNKLNGCVLGKWGRHDGTLETIDERNVTCHDVLAEKLFETDVSVWI